MAQPPLHDRRDARSRSPGPLLICLLGLATGLALLGLAGTVPKPGSSPEVLTVGSANVAVVHRFYAAANAVLRTGDATPLAALVAPDLVEHPTRASAVAGRAGLEQALLSRHAVFPDLQLIVEQARTTGDEVAVRVHAEGGETGSFLGLAVPPSLAAWGPVELFRIAEGRIVERWGSEGDPVLFAPRWEASQPGHVEVAPASEARRPNVALRRLVWEPGAALPVAHNPATWFLFVETGTLAVTADPDPSATPVHSPTRRGAGGAGPPDAIDPGREAALASDELLVVPAGAGFVVRNDGAVPATALLVAQWAPTPSPFSRQPTDYELATERGAAALGLAPGATGERRLANGVSARVLTTVIGVDVSPGSRLAVGQLILAPGAELALVDGAGSLVVAVEAGRLDLAVTNGRIWETSADGRSGPSMASVALSVGDGALVTTTAAGSWRAGEDEPAVVLVLAMTPPDAGSTTTGTPAA